MDHIAIDLGGRESQACVRDARGNVVQECRLRTAQLGKFLSSREPARVILETCTEAFGVADLALAAGHQVRIVPASLVKTLGVGARGIKNDKRDAQVLSEVSCRVDLPSVHIPSADARARKQLCRMRETMVRSRTRLVNSLRAWVRAQPGTRIRGGNVKTITKRVAELVPDDVLPPHVRRTMAAIDCLTEQIKEATAELEQIANEDALCRRLMTAPGVGPVVAIRYAAALDEVKRFKDAHRVESYLGLVPGEKSSSDRHYNLGITKAGAPHVRWALTQGAWGVWRGRHHGTPLHRWMIEVEKRRGRRVAVSAMARKLAGILYAMWRDEKDYQPELAAKQPPATE